MINIIREELVQALQRIDSGNSNISEDDQLELIKIFRKINTDELSKIESYNYLGISRGTFDNYIKKGIIPKGHKIQGINALVWNKYDLNKIKNELSRKKL